MNPFGFPWDISHLTVSALFVELTDLRDERGPAQHSERKPKTSDTVEGWFPGGRCHLTMIRNLVGPTHPVGPWQTRSTTSFPWGVFREAGRLTTSRFPAGLSKLRTPGRRGQPAARAYVLPQVNLRSPLIPHAAVPKLLA